MSLLSWFQQKLAHDAPHYQFLSLDPKQVRLKDGTPADSQPLQADTHYLRLWLTEMYLKKDVEWFKTWHPAVHCAVALQFGNKKETLVHVAGSSRLQGIEKNLDRVLSLNYALTPLLPFKGGTVSLDAGLLAMQGSDSVKTMLKVLGDFSSLLMVPQLSAALSVAGPLADGAAELLGATNGRLVLGLHQEWVGAGVGAGNNLLRAGYFAVVLADMQVLSENYFWVQDDRLRYGETLEKSTPLTGYDYLLFRLERRDERDDFDSLSAIQEPYAQALKMLEANNAPQAEMFLRAAKVAAYGSAELTANVDRKRVIDQLQRRYDEARQMLAQGASEELDLSLHRAMKGAVSPQAALASGPLRLADLGN